MACGAVGIGGFVKVAASLCAAGSRWGACGTVAVASCHFACSGRDRWFC